MANIKTQKFQQRMKALRGTKQNIMKQAFTYFKSITPIDTGNARRNTKLINWKIVANYPYAFILDLGRHMTPRGARGSNQAPRGMSNPTVQKFGNWVRNFIKGI